MVTENLIGNNVDFPKVLYDKHLKNDVSVNRLIEAYKEYNVGDFEWEGVKDSFKPIYDLIDGQQALIEKAIYEEIKKVSSSVKSRVSFVKTPAAFSFFAFRGDASKSPKWFFIDSDDNTYTEFPEICDQLRKYIQPDNIKAEHWTQETDRHLISAVQKLKQKERHLLPNKRKRALSVAEKLLDKHFKKTKDVTRKQLIDKVQKLFSTDHPEEHGIVDYYLFAQNWLDILQPVLNKKRKASRKKGMLSV